MNFSQKLTFFINYRLVEFVGLFRHLMVELIPFHIPWLSGNEKKYIDRVIELNRHAGNGSFTKRCQDHLEQMFGIPNVLLTTSCTAALELSAMAYDFNNRDEVIVPSYTFVSTASAFLRTGAKIVFAEIDPNTLMLDPIDVERKITKQTKAVVPVHYAGFSADLGNLESICEAANYLRQQFSAGFLTLTMDEFRRGIEDLSTAELKQPKLKEMHDVTV